MSSVLIASAISRKVPSPRMALCDLLATPARRMHENLMTADDRYGQRGHNGPTALPFWLDSVHCPTSASGRASLQSEAFQRDWGPARWTTSTARSPSSPAAQAALASGWQRSW